MNSTLLSEHDAQNSAKKHEAGICASFAMDFCKKQLASAAGNGKKIINAVTYGNASRIKKITKRQISYEKSGDLGTLAASYGLTCSSQPVERWSKEKGPFDDDPGTPADNLERIFMALQAAETRGCYYFSIKDRSLAGHGIALDTKNMRFADANVGVLSFDRPHMQTIITDCFSYLKAHNPVAFWVYGIQLKK